MTTDKPSDPNEYPLTVVATDVHGEECYRTQIDWTGVPRGLEDVPSDDLDRRRPRWAEVKVFNAQGDELHSRSNSDAGSADDDENVVVKDEGTTEADAQSNSPAATPDSKNPDKGTLKADDQAADKADLKAKDDKADAKAAKK
jgi:hypothetical protein